MHASLLLSCSWLALRAGVLSAAQSVGSALCSRALHAPSCSSVCGQRSRAVVAQSCTCSGHCGSSISPSSSGPLERMLLSVLRRASQRRSQHSAWATRCSLTRRSSGAPTACHQARPVVRYILHSPGLASCRRRPLNSNVRQHKNTSHEPQRFLHRPRILVWRQALAVHGCRYTRRHRNLLGTA